MEEKARKQAEIDKKKREMDEMTKVRIQKNENAALMFGAVNTIAFMAFAIMHISLSLDQYDVGNMNKFNRAVTLSTLPQIDIKKPLTPKQFMNKNELEDYLSGFMNYLFVDGSSEIKNKAFYHQLNHIVPYIKLINLQVEQIDCGSDVSNWRGKNTAAENDAEFTTEYVYPFDDDKCYATFN